MRAYLRERPLGSGAYRRAGRAGYCAVDTPGHFRSTSSGLILRAMSGFVVDSRTLLAVRDTLGRLHDQLLGMHTVVWHEWGTLGGHALESELEHFCGTWHYGVSELGGQLQDLTRRLGEASDAYERIEQHITQAGSATGSTGGASAHPTGSGPTSTSAHHPAAKHKSSGHHTAKHSEAKHHSDPGGMGGAGSKHYSGGAGLGPAPAGSGSSGHRGEKHGGGDTHKGGEKHQGVGSGTTVIGGGSDHGGGAKHSGNSGSGSGTTVIGGGGGNSGGSQHGGRHHPSSGSGSGTTVIGGGPTQSTSSGGSGTTTVDEKIHHAEDRQRAELASVLHMVKD
jgi:hypothetical protein